MSEMHCVVPLLMWLDRSGDYPLIIGIFTGEHGKGYAGACSICPNRYMNDLLEWLQKDGLCTQWGRGNKPSTLAHMRMGTSTHPRTHTIAQHTCKGHRHCRHHHALDAMANK